MGVIPHKINVTTDKIDLDWPLIAIEKNCYIASIPLPPTPIYLSLFISAPLLPFHNELSR